MNGLEVAIQIAAALFYIAGIASAACFILGMAAVVVGYRHGWIQEAEMRRREQERRSHR